MSSKPEKVVGTKISKPMPKKQLENHIVRFLKTQNMCVLATCKNNIPRATPMEYYSKGTSLYLVAEKGKKTENIKSNPNVSVGIFAPYKGWFSAKGVQITGTAKIITKKDEDEFNEALSVYEWQKSAEEIGIKNLPENIKLLKIEAKVIEIVDTSLKAKGFEARQVLTK